MKCSRCRKDNSPGAAYCFWCGDRLGDEVEMPRQPASQPDELQDMKQRLRQMSLRLSALERQVKAISRGMPIGECEDQPAPPAPDTPRETPEPPRRVEVVAPVAARLSKPTPRPVDQSLVASALSAVSPVAGRITSTGASAAAAEVRSDVRPQKSRELPRQRKPETPRPRRPEGAEDRQVGGRPAGGARWFQDWEQSLPGNWLSRIGIVALFIGLGFLAKLAYDRDWISPVVQLLTGLSIGVVLLWGGQHWNRRYRVWAQALTGGGVATLYLSFFASYALHDLMPFLPTFVLMFFVTVGAVAIALRQNSMAIAIIGIAGAFLVPIVLGASDHSDPAGGSGGHSPGLLIAYILLLDAGIVWLSSLRNWRWFTLLGWTGSLLVYGLWYLDSGREESLLTTLGGLTGIFVCFALATMLFHVVWRRTPGLTDLALMSLNAAVYFSASYFLMWDDYRGWLGTFSFMLAGLYGLLAWLAWWRSDSNRRLCQFAAGIAIVFLTIAIPIQFHRAWITVAWAAEGAVLTWIATRQSIPRLQLWALGVFGLVLVRLFAFDNVVAQAGFRPVMDDDRFVPFAMSILAFYAAAYFLRRDPKVLQPWLFPMMVLVGCFLTVWLLSADIVDFAGRRIIEARLDHSSHLHIRNLENARALALALTWTVYGLCLVAVGVWRKWGWLRVGGYVLVAAAVGMTVVLLNHVYAGIHRAGSTPILNYSFGAFAVSVFGLYLLSFIIANNRGRLHGAETAMFPVLVIGANLLSVWAMSAEVITFLSHMENTRSLVLVSLWTAYGLCLTVVGVWRRWDWLRVGGYVLVAAAVGTTAVLLNHASAGISRADSTPILNYGFGGFAVCTCGLYLLAYIIARSRGSLHGAETAMFPVLVIAANALSVWAMSAEVVTFLSHVENTRSLVLVGLWTAYGLCLTALGVWRGWSWLRVGGYTLAAGAVGMTVLLLNHTCAGIHRVGSTPILNHSFGGFAVSVLGLYLLAWIVAVNRGRLHQVETQMFPVIMLAASVLSIWAMSAEVVTFLSHMEHTRSLVLVGLWTAYGLCLMVVGVWRNWGWLRFGGYALVAGAVGMTALLLNHAHAEIGRVNSTPILNHSFGGFAVSVCGLYLLASIIARNRGRLNEAETQMFPLIVAAGNILSLWAMSAEVITFLSHAENTRSLVLVGLWAGYGLCLMAVGVWRNWGWLRFGGYALVAGAVGMTAFLLNHTYAEIGRVNSTPILNFSFGGFALSVVALYLLAFVMARNMARLHESEKWIAPLLLIAGNVLSLWAMSSEVMTYIPSGYGKSMGLTLVWASYAFVLVVVGILKKWRWFRVGGLVLLGVAILKLFVVDTFTLESGYRVAAYLTLGVLLLAGGFVYHRYAEAIKGFIMDQPAVGVGSGPDESHGEAA